MHRSVRGSDGDEIGWYKFEIDFPNFEYSIIERQGAWLAEWVRGAFRDVAEYVFKDAHANGEFFSDWAWRANWWLEGKGTREQNERGEPVWKEGGRWPIYGRGMATFKRAIRQVTSLVEAWGDNEPARARVNITIKKEGSFPIWFKPEKLTIYIYTKPLEEYHPRVSKWFEAAKAQYNAEVAVKRELTLVVNRSQARAEKFLAEREEGERIRAVLQKKLDAKERLAASKAKRKAAKETKKAKANARSLAMHEWWVKLKADKPAFVKAMRHRKQAAKRRELEAQRAAEEAAEQKRRAKLSRASKQRWKELKADPKAFAKWKRKVKKGRK